MIAQWYQLKPRRCSLGKGSQLSEREGRRRRPVLTSLGTGRQKMLGDTFRNWNLLSLGHSLHNNSWPFQESTWNRFRIWSEFLWKSRPGPGSILEASKHTTIVRCFSHSKVRCVLLSVKTLRKQQRTPKSSLKICVPTMVPP